MRQGLDLQEPHEAWSTVPLELVNPMTDIEEITRLTGYILKADQWPIPVAVSQ